MQNLSCLSIDAMSRKRDPTLLQKGRRPRPREANPSACHRESRNRTSYDCWSTSAPTYTEFEFLFVAIVSNRSVGKWKPSKKQAARISSSGNNIIKWCKISGNIIEASRAQARRKRQEKEAEREGGRKKA